MMAQPTASAATADNPTCWSGEQPPNGAGAACATMAWGERVRAIVKCDGFWSDYYRYGEWKYGAHNHSLIWCDVTSDDRLGHWYEVVIDT